jgi:hypothetical protein
MSNESSTKTPGDIDHQQQPFDVEGIDGWLGNLTEEQVTIRDAVIWGRSHNKTIDIGPALDKLLTPTELESWDSTINKIVYGEGEIIPEDARLLREFSLKLGLRDREPLEIKPSTPIEQVNETAKTETLSNSPLIASLDVFDVNNYDEVQLGEKFSADYPPTGYIFLYRGIKGEWKRPSLTEKEYEELEHENDEIVQRLIEFVNNEAPRGDHIDVKRFDVLRDILRTEGNQWFSDRFDDALRYAGNSGSLIRIAAKGNDIFPYTLETLRPAEKSGTVFLVPREWFVQIDQSKERISRSIKIARYFLRKR